MICSICKEEAVGSIEEAIDHDWYPTWWMDDIEQPPCCRTCGEKYLMLAEDGEYEPKDIGEMKQTIKQTIT